MDGEKKKNTGPWNKAEEVLEKQVVVGQMANDALVVYLLEHPVGVWCYKLFVSFDPWRRLLKGVWFQIVKRLN